MILPKCPNCKKLYKFYKSDDKDFTLMMMHESDTCPHKAVAYQDMPFKCIEDIREYFKKEFPWKYKDSKKALS